AITATTHAVSVNAKKGSFSITIRRNGNASAPVAAEVRSVPDRAFLLRLRLRRLGATGEPASSCAAAAAFSACVADHSGDQPAIRRKGHQSSSSNTKGNVTSICFDIRLAANASNATAYHS